jgi:hypothetical protein
MAERSTRLARSIVVPGIGVPALVSAPTVFDPSPAVLDQKCSNIGKVGSKMGAASGIA